MFQLLKGAPDHGNHTKLRPELYNLYLNALLKKSQQWADLLRENPGADDRRIRRQLLFYGIRTFNHARRDGERTEDMIQLDMQLAEYLLAEIATLTPRELTQLFPIDKRYDGERWETKDYYSTMRELEVIGLDNRIGEHSQELTWDYMNPDIREFTVNRLGVYSEARQLQTGRSIGEEWADVMGLRTYHMHTDPNTGKKFMMDKTGRSVAVRKHRPRYLRALH